ncbi:MAG: MAPEG family protein [Pseudomonadales bacterium]|nr:MAPEG family protein [Pseudomonadales bacterium]
MLVTPFYAAIFGLFFIYLSRQVIMARRKYQVAIGDGDHVELSRAIRAHGNFSEYVPFSLLLVYFAELQTQSAWVAHIFCLILLAGRVSHAYSNSQVKEDFRFRVFGLASTFTVMGIGSLVILVSAVM